MSSIHIEESKLNTKAVTSLLLGILSIVCLIFAPLGLPLGIAGLLLGISGWKEIKRLNEDGKKLAVSGIVCSLIGTTLPLLIAVIGYLAYTNTSL
jgi:hypothetical protein